MPEDELLNGVTALHAYKPTILVADYSAKGNVIQPLSVKHPNSLYTSISQRHDRHH